MLKQGKIIIIKPDESLTWFHLDNLDGCQLSTLFVSRLIVTKKKYKHNCCCVVNTTDAPILFDIQYRQTTARC